MSRRLLGPGLLAAAIAVTAYLLLSSGSTYELRLQFQNAGQLVKGNLVTVGGVRIGTVQSIELTSHNQADVRVRITNDDFSPVHEGTQATVRISSLSSVANRVISLEPGPNNAPTLESGATIPVSATSTPVEIDQVISTLDRESRSNLQDLIHGSAGIYAGREGDANRTLAALNPAVGETAGTLDQLDRDQAAFRSAIVDSASLMSAVASESASFDGLLGGTSTLMSSLAQKTGSISAILRKAPAALPQLSSTFSRYQHAFAQLTPDARRISAVAPLAATTIRQLKPTLQAAEPALVATRPLLAALGSTLRKTPGLARTGVPALGAATTAMQDFLPILKGTVPYFPDILHGVVGGFGGTTGGYYDANGQYLRVGVTAGVASLTGISSELSALVPKDLKPSFSNMNRCPGGADSAAPDGSSPRTGIQDCKREQGP